MATFLYVLTSIAITAVIGGCIAAIGSVMR